MDKEKKEVSTSQEDTGLQTAPARRGSGQFQFASSMDWRVLITHSTSCIGSGHIGATRSEGNNICSQASSRTDADGSVTVVAMTSKKGDILAAQQCIAQFQSAGTCTAMDTDNKAQMHYSQSPQSIVS